MKRFFIGVVLLALAGAAPGSQSTAYGKEDLLDQIKRARKAVAGESVQVIYGVVGQRRVRVGRRKYQTVDVRGVVGREMALAIADETGRIQIARVIKRDPGLEVLTLGFVITVRRDNGINSDFAVVKPAGGRVLAVKYPVLNDNDRFGPYGPVIQAVYTPYSAEIATREVVERGIEVQDEFIDKAYARLKQKGVFSRAFPGRKVHEVIPRDVVTVLLMNEHIDPGDFKSEGLTRHLVEKVLTILATNEEKAYAYSISSASARGLVQMIPSTYRLMLSKYPEAGLNSNFALGMADPINAVVAQVLLCDADWQAIRTRSDIPADRIGPYLAAAYNGGVGRVLNILARGETNWMEEPEGKKQPTVTVARKVPVKVKRRGKVRTTYVTKHYTQPIFRAETSKYVRQYHWINDYFVARKVKGFKPFPSPRKE